MELYVILHRILLTTVGSPRKVAEIQAYFLKLSFHLVYLYDLSFFEEANNFNCSHINYHRGLNNPKMAKKCEILNLELGKVVRNG